MSPNFIYGCSVVVVFALCFGVDFANAEVKCAELTSCETCKANSSCGWFNCINGADTAKKICMEKMTTANNCTEINTCATSPPPQPHVEQGRRFDGASFIGGMILSAGLILLGYFGWQWYRTRSKSYHSL